MTIWKPLAGGAGCWVGTLIGGGLLVGGTHDALHRGSFDGDAAIAFALAMPFLFMALAFRGIDFDAASRVVTTWAGPAIPFVAAWRWFRKSTALGNAGQVVYADRVFTTARGGHFTSFPIWLEGPGGWHVDLGRSHAYLRARRHGERFAKLLRVPLVDRAGGNESRRRPEILDTPLVQQPIRLDGPEALREPAAAGVTIEERDGRTRLTLEPRRYYTAVGF